MKYYKVTKYVDKIWEKEADQVPENTHSEFYFTVLEDANKFIVARAKGHVLACESALLGAQRREKKCERKFGFRLHP